MIEPELVAFYNLAALLYHHGLVLYSILYMLKYETRYSRVVP